MKAIYILGIVALLATTVVFAGISKTTSVEYIDIDGDGIADTVIVESSYKTTKKSATITHTYFSEDYLEYLGQEVIVNGEVILDTFAAN